MPRRDWTWPQGKWPRTWFKMWNCEWAKNIPFDEWNLNRWCGFYRGEWNRRSAEQKAEEKEQKSQEYDCD